MNLSTPIAGCMRWGKWGSGFNTNDYYSMIQECLTNGITTFDHADIYGDYTTEHEFGKALEHNNALRDKIQIITKCGIKMMTENRPHHTIKSYDTGRQHIMSSVDASLKNFNTDYIDVLLIHRPDPLLNPTEVAEAITQLKQQGKIISFGVSNFLPVQINALHNFIKIEYNQFEVSLLNPVAFINGVLDNCLQHYIKPMAWAPLGGGVLSDESHPRYRTISSAAMFLAEKYNTGINQVLIAFLLKHPSNIIPVVGSTKMERLLQASNASGIILTNEDWFTLYAASTGEEVA